MNSPRPEIDLNAPPWALNIPEAAPLIPMGARQLREMCERGEIYAFRVGRVWKIPKQAIKRLLNGEPSPVATPDRPALRLG